MLNHARQAAATSPLLHAGARALYLGTRDKKRVTCTDQALVVHNALQQIRRYPLERISRVVSSAVTDWSGDALMLCLKHGIGITWLDGKGNALGTCYPAQRRYPAFATAIELLTETPQGLDRYNNWLRSRRMDVLLRWGKDFAQVISPGQWEATRQSWVYTGQFEEHLAAPLRGHSLAWVGAQLSAHGLQPLLWSPTAQAIDLENDLCTLFWAERNLCAGSMAVSIQSEESITTLFERWNARNGSALLVHITSLSRIAMKAYTTGDMTMSQKL